jgi:hypothetical protein
MPKIFQGTKVKLTLYFFSMAEKKKNVDKMPKMAEWLKEAASRVKSRQPMEV